MTDISPQAPGTRARALVEFASEHFVLFSALAILGGVLAATVFTFSYLAVFDIRLIWIVEYGDILKVGLVFAVVIVGCAAWISLLIENFIANVASRSVSAIWTIRLCSSGAVIIALALLTASVYWNILPKLAVLLIFAALQIFMMALLALRYAVRVDTIRVSHWLTDGLLLITFIGTIGIAVGEAFKITPGFKRDVYTAHGDLLDVGLVMMTARYVILVSGDRTVMVPLSEVWKIEARPKTQDRLN